MAVVLCDMTQMIIHFSEAPNLPSVRSSIHPILQIILVPQTAATTFAFSSVCFFFYAHTLLIDRQVGQREICQHILYVLRFHIQVPTQFLFEIHNVTILKKIMTKRQSS